jgi:hypothetical protein
MTATPRYLPVRHDWADPFRITREYATDVQVADDGSEVRVQLRDEPNLRVEMRGVFLTEMGAGSILAAFRGATRPLLYYVPLWCDATDVTSAVSVGANSVACDTTTRPLFDDATHVMLWRDERTNEMLAVDSVSDSSVTFDGVTTSGYALGSRVVPLRPMWLTLPVRVTWENGRIANAALSFVEQKPQAGLDLTDTAHTPVAASVKIYVHGEGRSGEQFIGQAWYVVFLQAVAFDAAGIPLIGAEFAWDSDASDYPDLVIVTPMPNSSQARVVVETNSGSRVVTATSGTASHTIGV